MKTPPFAIGVVGVKDLNRRHGVDLPDRQGGLVAPVPVRAFTRSPVDSSGKLSDGGLSETESLHLRQDASLANTLADFVGADVRRLRENSGSWLSAQGRGIRRRGIASADDDRVRHRKD